VLSVNTTVIALVAPPAAGTGDAGPLDDVRATNVRVLRIDADAPALERAASAYEQARRTRTPYLLHDADPLAWVADAWAERFEGPNVAGALEVAVAETLARWRARSLDLPDYYLVVDPEGFSPVLRHWFLGVLGSAAPRRVVTGRPEAPVVDRLVDLRPGPWWPDLDRLLADLDRILPEQAGLGPAPQPGGEALATPIT
jgi:hypothetical protein